MLRGRNTFSGIFSSASVYGDWSAINYIGDDLILDGISVRFYDAGAAGGTTIRLRVYTDTTQYCDLIQFTTTAADDVRVLTPIGLPMIKRARVVGSQYFAFVYISPDTAVADLIELTMWGRYVVPTTMEPQAQPVSLEGYKWPLTRRT